MAKLDNDNPSYYNRDVLRAAARRIRTLEGALEAFDPKHPALATYKNVNLGWLNLLDGKDE
jgi:hypothetical protein